SKGEFDDQPMAFAVPRQNGDGRLLFVIHRRIDANDDAIHDRCDLWCSKGLPLELGKKDLAVAQPCGQSIGEAHLRLGAGIEGLSATHPMLEAADIDFETFDLVGCDAMGLHQQIQCIDPCMRAAAGRVWLDGTPVEAPARSEVVNESLWIALVAAEGRE